MQRVIADGNTVIADFIVAAVGMSINRELLRGTPITSERAILTDEFCQTNVPHIWAAGDCAALFDPLFGKHRILDHWDHARVSGSLAGRNMAGHREPYAAVNNFFSDVFDLSLNGWGEARQVSAVSSAARPTPTLPTSSKSASPPMGASLRCLPSITPAKTTSSARSSHSASSSTATKNSSKTPPPIWRICCDS